MPTTEYYARACEIESKSVPGTPKAWQAGTPYWGLCDAVAVEWALQARKSPFWRFGVRNSIAPVACAVGQIWGLGGAVSVGGRAWPRLTAGLWPFYALPQ